jgi:hypothetical protein
VCHWDQSDPQRAAGGQRHYLSGLDEHMNELPSCFSSFSMPFPMSCGETRSGIERLTSRCL